MAHIPVSSVVKEAVATFISLEEKRFRLTLEALADVDVKRTIDPLEVEAWADGLSKSKRPARR